MANEIVTEILLDLDQLKKKLKEAEGLGENSGKKVGQGIGQGFDKGFDQFSKNFKRTIVGLGAAFAGAFAFKKIIHAAVEAEDALNDFNAALRAAGNFSPQASEKFLHFAESLQRVTTVSDDVILKNASVLASLGRLSGEGLERATKASLDFAAAMNMDTGAAFNLVAKAATGYTSALSRYGIQVKSTGDAQADFNRALTLIEQKFGGIAQSKVNTFSGAVAQLGNNFANVLEELGLMITKSPALVAGIKFVSEEFAQLVERLRVLGHSDFFSGFVQQTINIARVFASVLVPVGEMVVQLFQAIGEVIGGVAAAVMQAATGEFKAAFDTMAAVTKETFNKTFDFDATKATETFFIRMQEAMAVAQPVAAEAGRQLANSIQEPMNQITFDHVVHQMRQAANKIQVSAASIAKYLNQALVNGAGNAFAAFGGALVKGENAFKAFGKAILGAFGQMLIQLGTQVLAVGLLMANVPILFGLQGAAAIAAGIGMIVAGGALTALAGGAGGVGAPGGAGAATGGGGVAGGSLVSPVQDMGQGFSDLQEEDKKARVVVNIQGNVLDRRQTGLEILEVLNENFASSGGYLATSGSA